jgi:hypothetical protein
MGFQLEVKRSELAERAHQVLRTALAASGGGIPRLHAGEALALHGEAASVGRVFAAALRQEGEQPTARIGLWRVMARCAATDDEKDVWISKLESALDPKAPDWIGATESLSKLGCALSGAPRDAVRLLVRTGAEADVMFGLWAEALAGDRTVLRRIGRGLDLAETNGRLRAAYILGWLRIKDPELLAKLSRAANGESETSTAYPYIIGAAFLLDADPARSPWPAARPAAAWRCGKARRPCLESFRCWIRRK